jgi:hypothetical protein
MAVACRSRTAGSRPQGIIEPGGIVRQVAGPQDALEDAAERTPPSGGSVLPEHDRSPLPADPDATLKPPQFTLRTLLILMAVVAVLLGVMSAVGSMWSLGVLFVLLLVAGHVAGNSLGTKLRSGAPTREAAVQRTPTQPPGAMRPRATGATPLAMPRRLREPTRLHWINIVLAAAGAAAGSYYGGSALVASYPDAPTSAFVLAYVSSGVLGGFAGFVVSSFLSVTRQALSEAHAGSDRHQPRKAAPPASVERH